MIETELLRTLLSDEVKRQRRFVHIPMGRLGKAEELAKDGDLASVYRNLDTLEEVGLVRHVHLGHGPGLYSLAGADTEFVTCERCGAYEAVEPRRLDAAKAAIERELGYRPRFTHFPIVGVCASCQEHEGR